MTNSPTATMNRPRNVLLVDADPREPVTVSFVGTTSGVRHCLTVHQTPNEETWPGGALWDCGVLLSQFLVALACLSSGAPKTTTTTLDQLTITTTLLEMEGEIKGGKDGSSNNNNKNKSPKKSANQSNAKSKKNGNNSKLCTRTTANLSSRLGPWMQKHGNGPALEYIQDVLSLRPGTISQHPLTIVELGCGVGLTGLVASITLGAAVTMLTDLTEVVEQVTQPNVVQNTQAATTKNRRNKKHPPPQQHQDDATDTTIPYRTIQHDKGGGKVVAMPLCWGDSEQEQHVLTTLQRLVPHERITNTNKKRNSNARSNPSMPPSGTDACCQSPTAHPTLILLGDVAYQHGGPGAPSHFDILLSTLKTLMAADHYHDTLLMFGTRMRMPASLDLLLMLEETFTSVLVEPIPAQVLDPAMEHVKHNMTLHVFRNRSAPKS